jgi:hypothetical protein
MGIINSIKNAISGTAAWLRSKTQQEIPTPPPVPSGPVEVDPSLVGVIDTATPPLPDISRYLHVSVPLFPIENPHLRKLLGMGYTMGRGQTHNIGNNAMKRSAGAMAKASGMNNKERCRLRSRIKARAEELRAQMRGEATA